MLQSVDIGGWYNYATYTNSEQRQLQRSNLIKLPVECKRDVPIHFIFTSVMDAWEAYIEVQLNAIPICDTQTIVCDEVFYTTKIEGAKTTRKRTSEIHNGQPIRDDYSERMIWNCFNATKYFNISSNKLTTDILIEGWKLLTTGACDNRSLGDSGYRTSDNIVIGSHTPPHFEDVPYLIDKLIAFYNGKEFDEIPIIKACIIHYVFEVIHPFCDGNGRLGRLLMNNYLISRGFDTARAVSFSKYIDRTRGLYDAAFVKSENIYNDCTPFIEYMLGDVMCAALEEAASI